MKKVMTISLLATMLTLFSCSSSPRVNSTVFPEYVSYKEKGGALNYEDWIKRREALAITSDGDSKGASVEYMLINAKGELIIELSDGTIINAGSIGQ